MNSDLTNAEQIIESYGCKQANLIAIMQEIQAEYKYLSEETLTLIAEKLGVSPAKVYSVATFYENFPWRPRDGTSSRFVRALPAMCGNPAQFTTPSMTIWA